MNVEKGVIRAPFRGAQKKGVGGGSGDEERKEEAEASSGTSSSSSDSKTGRVFFGPFGPDAAELVLTLFGLTPALFIAYKKRQAANTAASAAGAAKTEEVGGEAEVESSRGGASSLSRNRSKNSTGHDNRPPLNGRGEREREIGRRAGGGSATFVVALLAS